jgi:cytochrome c biogenesis protein CcmG/thiol:disulfide interchange protein DsbE
MDAPVALSTPAPATSARRSRLTTLAVMAVTAVIIGAVAVFVNQPPASADGVTGVNLTGAATGPAPTVGEPAPDFTATTVDGQSVTLSDFRGTPVWLTFGASWCQPCRAENPDIKATAERFGDDLVVLAVFISEDAAGVAEYAERVGLDYRKVADPGTAIASQYRILGIPSHYFIDADGVLRQMRIGTLDIDGMTAAVEDLQP